MHPIIALWSHPRSMSTAMERVMRERGDLDCAHEPFMYDYYVHHGRKPFAMFDVQADQPVAYPDIRDHLLKRAETRPVFFKDMSYYVWEQVLADPAFSARLVNCFLIRNPVASIPSYFKLDPEASLEEIGLEAQYLHYSGLVERGETPVVINANDVRRDVKGVMTALWSAIDLPYVDAAFDWQRPTPEDWQQVEGWHGNVSEASGIKPLTQADLDAQQERFEQMAQEHPKMRAYLAHHLPYFEALKGHAIGA
ncbi:MAG: hypothetical protein AB8B82_02035 [Roseovarius sp.]